MPTLKTRYIEEVAPALMKKFEYKSVMQIPKIDKVVVNVGCGEARDNAKVLDAVVRDLTTITGQKAIITIAKKSVANFKVREGMPVGAKVTLRGDKMWEFLDRLFNVALPRVRDFQGINPNSFDGRGNYALGIKEQLIFPEIEYDKIDKIRGMDVVICTTAHTDEEARALLEKANIVNIPFSDQLPLAQLHWLVADKTGSITVESTADGLHIYDNPVGVLTNNPPFPQQLFALNNYRALSPRTPASTFADGLDLPVYSRGLGALGLPGDLSSQSRFVRAAFVRMNAKSGSSEAESVGQFFHILHAVEQQRGCCELDGGKYEITLYTSCCNADKGIYYYTTYGNHQITAVDMHRENLDGDRLVRYPLVQGEQIALQN